MKIIGINEYSHDTSVSIVEKNKILFALEEERLSNNKHQRGFMINKNGFPKLSYELSKKLVNSNYEIAFGWDINYFKALYNSLMQCRNHTKMNPNNSYKYFQLIKEITTNYISRKNFLKEFKNIKFVEHHLAHASSSYRCSNFNKALIFVLDGAGETNWMSIYIGNKNNIKKLKSFNISSSLGNVYSFATYLIGFNDFSEGKFMGLAGYGKPLDDKFLDFDIKREKFKINYKKIRSYNKYRLDDSNNIKQIHKDIAATFQKNFEEAMLKCYKYYINKYEIRDICLAGGISLNCLLNGKLINSKEINNLYCPNFVSDMGVSLGAALEVSSKYSDVYKLNITHSNFGLKNNLSISELKKLNSELSFNKISISEFANELAQGKIIACVKDKNEFGPRALGNRSILASPSIKGLNLKINKIKKRESWRPFACMILRSKVQEYLDCPNGDYPFMNVAFKVKKKNKLKNVCHIDGTTRVQTISEENKFYYNLLNEFEKLTATPALLNTSLNDKTSPTITYIENAINLLDNSNLDAIYYRDYLIEKPYIVKIENPRWLQEIIDKGEYKEEYFVSNFRKVKGCYDFDLSKVKESKSKDFEISKVIDKHKIKFDSKSSEVSVKNV